MAFDLFDSFRITLARRAMWAEGTSVLVAVSGGADSVCLLDLFRRLRESSSFSLAVAHLNHALRGPESDRDEEFVGELALRHGLPFHAQKLSPGELAEAPDGLEAAGRRARYAFLEKAARSMGAQRVALGHTRDDQAETFLMRLLRGAGTRGLSGIYPVVEGRFIRPLLDAGRRDVEAYLRERSLAWREDSTNADLSRTRNRIRARLVPMLREDFNTEIGSALARATEILREDDAYLGEVTSRVAERLLKRDPLGLSLSIPAMRVLPRALRRRLLRSACEKSFGAGKGPALPDFESMESLEELIRLGRHGAAITLSGGYQARVYYSDLTFVNPDLARFDEEVPLAVPGTVSLPQLGVRLTAAEMAGPRDFAAPPAPERAWLDADTLPGPLRVRARRAGDAFMPLGSTGESKLKAYLIDRKVPRPARERIPLVLAGHHIAWVVGFQIDDRYKVTAGTRRILVLSKETP
jgi:tRNA(Ile)-lysidine synthase